MTRQGRRPGRAMSRAEVVKQANAAMRRHTGGPLYKWWLARELFISMPTLRNYLRDYRLLWPPPWNGAASTQLTDAAVSADDAVSACF